MANQTTVKIPLDDALLYRGAPNTTTLPATTLVATVENVSLKVTYEEAKVQNRLTKIAQQLPTIAAVDLEIAFAADSADTHLAAFRSALINRYPIPILVSNGSEAALTRFSGLVGVFSGDDDQRIAGVAMQKFTLKPWAVGAGGTQPGFNA